jgi:hypothetical protein
MRQIFKFSLRFGEVSLVFDVVGGVCNPEFRLPFHYRLGFLG